MDLAIAKLRRSFWDHSALPLAFIQFGCVFMASDFLAIHDVAGLMWLTLWSIVVTIALFFSLAKLAQEKGYSRWCGLFALFSLLGVFAVMMLRSKRVR